jgi:hypothetical protein
VRPLTRWLLVTLVFVLTLFVTPKVHALYMNSLSLTELAESEGGEPRIVRIAGGESIDVVVHRSETWCHCPGLGVAAQSRSADPDSIVLLADALFRAFRDEAAREPARRRCLTVTLQLGIGRQDPMNPRKQYGFSLWRRRTDERWVLFTTSGESAVRSEAQRTLGALWPQVPRATSTPLEAAPKPSAPTRL